MIVLAHQGGCLPYVLALVAMLAVGDPVSHDTRADNGFDPGQKRGQTGHWKHPTSNLLGALQAVGAYEWAGASDGFCDDKGLHAKTMKEIHELRLQLCRIVNTMVIEGANITVSPDWDLPPPTAPQE